MVYIYTLSDPITGVIRYVGKSANPKKRFNRHLRESKINTKSHKKAWINSLLKQNLKPILDIIDTVKCEDWRFWEKYWICQIKSWGFVLTNEMNGGDGVDIGNTPWNKGVKGLTKENITSFKKGERRSIKTEFKKGERRSIKTEFKKGQNPWNVTKVQQFDLNGNLINEFDKVIDAANYVNVHQSAISKAIKTNCKIKNYLWKKKN